MLKAIHAQDILKVLVHLVEPKDCFDIVLVHFAEKMPPMGHQPCDSQIDQPYVMRGVALHQFQQQMMDGRIVGVVFLVCKRYIVKQQIPVPGFHIVSMKPALLAANKEPRIHLGNFPGEDILHELDPLLPPVQAPPCRPETTPLCRWFCLLEHVGAPHRVPVEFAQTILFIRHRIADRVSAYIQA